MASPTAIGPLSSAAAPPVKPSLSFGGWTITPTGQIPPDPQAGVLELWRLEKLIGGVPIGGGATDCGDDPGGDSDKHGGQESPRQILRLPGLLALFCSMIFFVSLFLFPAGSLQFDPERVSLDESQPPERQQELIRRLYGGCDSFLSFLECGTLGNMEVCGL